MGEVESRLEVDLNDLIPHLFGHTHKERVARDAGVIDQDIETSEIRHDGFYYLMGGLEISRIGGIESHLHA